jgi:hypothetical protein
MSIKVAHVLIQNVNCCVFEADSTTHTPSGRRSVLADLTRRARLAGLRVDKAALAFMESGRLNFFGADDLVQYLANNGLPHWTNTLTV